MTYQVNLISINLKKVMRQMFNGIDLSSDTATQPTLEMKQAMFMAQLGDEQKREDPTTLRLQEMIAELLGFEQALFFPSATMANQAAIALLCAPGDKLVAAENCHLFTSEAGGVAIHSNIMVCPIQTKTGIFTANDLHTAAHSFRKGPRYSNATCVSIENTTNFGGGLAWDLDTLTSVLDKAKELNLKTHLDGSRLFNAAIKLNVPPKKLAAGFNTVTICLSKGLGCPMGALLAFPAASYTKVEYLKHLFGGGLRQSGILAAAGVYALKYNISRLAEDHALAELFTLKLQQEVPDIRIEAHPYSTNMVFFSWQGAHLSPAQFHEICCNRNFRFSQIADNRFRAVFHLDISPQDIHYVIDNIKEIAAICGGN